MTGIDALLPDTYFNGAGFHETSRGGKLGVHADFRIHGQLNVQRRIDLPIYLNETWQDEWRGQLEEQLTPDGVKRRSVALYCCTASKNVYNEVPNLCTVYQARPSDGAAIKKEAREFKTEQHLRDWALPALLRGG